MTRKYIKRWLPEITHWANGGTLWYYSKASAKWVLATGPINWINDEIYVIEDEHFEARKAFALGEAIQGRKNSHWYRMESPTWDEDYMYRVEIVYPKFFKEKSSGIIVKFSSLTSGVVVEGVDSPQKGTGFTWNCFVSHDRTDWWEECDEPKWYDNIPKKGVLCWVSVSAPTNEVARIISYYNSGIEYPFGTKGGLRYKYATPVSPEEFMEGK